MPLTAGDPLPEDDLAAVLARLPELTGETGEQVEFNLPERSCPRRAPARRSRSPSRRHAAPVSAVESGPLEVLRYSPEGEIPIAPFVSVTFNQPMVPWARWTDLAAAEVPVKIEPALPGTWRWLGTKTLTFQYDFGPDRPPAQGDRLYTSPSRPGPNPPPAVCWPETVDGLSSTPPPKVISTYPAGHAPAARPALLHRL